VALLAVALGALLAAGCADRPDSLRLADLTEGERLYLERLVVLERARTAALLDRPRGEALLDSLAAAWGDSVVHRTVAGAPSNPARARLFGLLIGRVVRAEQDSLLAGDPFARLRAPLPDPPPAAKVAAPGS